MDKKETPVNEQENEVVVDQTSTEETTEQTTADNQAEDVTAEEVEEVVAEETTEKAEAPKSTGKKLSEVEQLKKELGEMKDKYLRIFAEFDNYRKRTIKERQDIIKLAAKDSLSALLPAVDDFDRAIKLSKENENEADIPEGVVLIFNKLYKALEQQGIKVMETTGVDFDPELHEALTKIPAPTEELKGKIIDTIEKGYYLNDTIIRYPKVVVGE